MNRGVLNLLIDTVAAALLTALVGTGYLLGFVLPPGTHRTHILWGLLRHQWGAMHAWISLGLLAVLAVHVALHWRWLVMGLSKRVGVATWAVRSPRLAGLTVLTAAVLPLTTLVLAAHVSVRMMDPALHPLEDDPRARAAPPTPGTVAGRAARRSQSWPRRQWAPTPTRLARRITRALRPCGTFRWAKNVVGHRRCVQACSPAPWEARF
jgi:Domain of unknown function (DUF4405)